MRNELLQTSLRRHLDLPVSRAAQVAASLPLTTGRLAIVLHGPHGFCAVSSESALVGFGDSVPEICADLESQGWIPGFLADDLLP